ncbi:hypothetical protein GF378_02940 [Candidatus Pacearchaeota archaeon]|nr:hypothetical protein [Candidatus Pacearchaeota archaeon]
MLLKILKQYCNAARLIWNRRNFETYDNQLTHRPKNPREIKDYERILKMFLELAVKTGEKTLSLDSKIENSEFKLSEEQRRHISDNMASYRAEYIVRYNKNIKY